MCEALLFKTAEMGRWVLQNWQRIAAKFVFTMANFFQHLMDIFVWACYDLPES